MKAKRNLFLQGIILFMLLSVLTTSCNNQKMVVTQVFEKGYVRYNYDETTIKRYGNLRGHLKVYVYDNWVEVINLDKKNEHWIIPRERVVYIGKEIK